MKNGEYGVYKFEFALSIEAYDQFALAASEAGVSLEVFLQQAMGLRMAVQPFVVDGALTVLNSEGSLTVLGLSDS